MVLSASVAAILTSAKARSHIPGAMLSVGILLALAAIFLLSE